jgi:hypothetical protein
MTVLTASLDAPLDDGEHTLRDMLADDRARLDKARVRQIVVTPTSALG